MRRELPLPGRGPVTLRGARTRDRRRHEPSTGGKSLIPHWIAWRLAGGALRSPGLDLPPSPSPGFSLPLAVTYRDDSGPFAIEAMVTAWRRALASGEGPAIILTLGPGTLHDADKGAFPLDG